MTNARAKETDKTEKSKKYRQRKTNILEKGPIKSVTEKEGKKEEKGGPESTRERQKERKEVSEAGRGRSRERKETIRSQNKLSNPEVHTFPFFLDRARSLSQKRSRPVSPGQYETPSQKAKTAKDDLKN